GSCGKGTRGPAPQSGGALRVGGVMSWKRIQVGAAVVCGTMCALCIAVGAWATAAVFFGSTCSFLIDPLAGED
ncbi:MAG TPA: hypothetical protein VFE78_32225, partial [Gemmataceae bacterium]|nr:hypothetical protein [Gemmataceae bacterium]